MSDTVDYDNMSDEEFENAPAPTGGVRFEHQPSQALEADEEGEFSSSDGTFESALDENAEASESDEADEAETPEGEPVDEEAGSSDEPEEHTTPDQSTSDEETSEETAEDTSEPDTVDTGTTDTQEGGDDPQADEASSSGSDDAAGSETSDAPDPAAEYARIMAPFKANGREVTPKSPDEVIRLMQMGANYSQKMQALKPNLRMMRMLENKGLLDEQKLNYLIDLNDKNPKAIQKLLHESKIDPLDLDTAETPNYTPTNHSVSDEQFAYQETLHDLTSTDSGKETAQVILGWDTQSRRATFQDPKIMSVIHEHREAGIYDRIVNELEHQKLLGQFLDVPFINAYKAVGDYLHQRGELEPAPQEQSTPAGNAASQANTPREMVETRTAPPKAALKNGDRVSGTTPPRSSPSPAKTPQKPLHEMTDEEILAMPLP